MNKEGVHKSSNVEAYPGFPPCTGMREGGGREGGRGRERGGRGGRKREEGGLLGRDGGRRPVAA